MYKIILMFFKNQDQEQVLNDSVDGKEIYNTIRRKTKDAFYKNIVKKGYLLKKGQQPCFTY
ncbi:Ras GTPase-activating protein 1 [Saguinus oedipus]|uniref:Ras GTPase-activating protein 1 n=1 Tax=Saguinus oedipus TaxID=9490 RepID=A0ABQ9W8X7_SAGOE|nr:Ras GTPase-activating protein 1 [Saguinus oedipus]